MSCPYDRIKSPLESGGTVLLDGGRLEIERVGYPREHDPITTAGVVADRCGFAAGGLRRAAMFPLRSAGRF